MLEIGAGVTFARIREHPLVKEHLPALHEMAAGVGAVAIQNMATLGGNLMSASAAGDAAPLLLALDAEVVFVSSRGERVLPLGELYRGYRETVRQPSELLCKVRIPSSLFGTPQKFFKVGTRKALTISRLSLGCSVVQETPGTFSRVRLAVGVLLPGQCFFLGLRNCWKIALSPWRMWRRPGPSSQGRWYPGRILPTDRV